MKIVQITDLHIPNSNEKIRIENAFDKLQNCITELLKVDFDILIVTGDIAYNLPNNYSYNYFKTQLQRLEKPMYVIPGNHDSWNILSPHISDIVSNETSWGAFQFNDFEFLLLDSSLNIITNEQLEFLKSYIDEKKGKPLTIFVHHPVAPVNALFMEAKYPLKNRNEVIDILTMHNNTISIYCGHYHAQTVSEYKNIKQITCPSLLYQISTEFHTLHVDVSHVAYSIIDYSNMNQSSQVVWL